jgi:uncharacterized membrane protein
MAGPSGIQQNTDVTPGSDRRALMIALAYLWPLALVPLLAARRDGEIQWHARYGLLLMAAEVAILSVLSVMSGIALLTNFGLGIALGMVVWLIWVATIALQLVAMLRALNGERLRLPPLSTIADRISA